MAFQLTKFLKRSTDNRKVAIKGKHVNTGAGYGLEIPCEHTLHGDSFSVKWLQTKLAEGGFQVK